MSKQSRKRQRQQREKEVEQHRRFMLAQMNQLAAGAYAGYLGFGRGTLVILYTAENLYLAGLDKVEVAYITDQDALPNEDIKRMVKEYNPEKEVCLLIQCSDGGWGSYRFMPQPTLPPDAYKASL